MPLVLPPPRTNISFKAHIIVLTCSMTVRVYAHNLHTTQHPEQRGTQVTPLHGRGPGPLTHSHMAGANQQTQALLRDTLARAYS